jgi:hypothetical protein
VTAQPLTISSGDAGFPGEIDEVRLSGGTEPVAYRWGDGEHVPGWKKVVRFDRRGHLDARYHTDDVSLVLADVELDAVAAQPRTAVAADYSVTFEEWLGRASDPPPLREKIEEARLVAALGAARKIVIEVDRLGNVR